MRLCWGIVAVLAVLHLGWAIVTLPQLLAIAILVYALGGSKLLPD